MRDTMPRIRQIARKATTVEFISTVTRRKSNEVAYCEVFATDAARATEMTFINQELPGLFARQATAQEYTFVHSLCFGPTFVQEIEEEEQTAYEHVHGSGRLPEGWEYAIIYPSGTWVIRRIAW